jgi:hypothetical protein
MLLGGPVLNVIEIVETKTDALGLFRGNMGEQGAAENCDSRRDIEPCLVERNELASYLSLSKHMISIVLETEHFRLRLRPITMIRFMIAKDKENNLEPLQLSANESKESIVFGVANISQQCQEWRFRVHGKNIIRRRHFQMEIR